MKLQPVKPATTHNTMEVLPRQLLLPALTTTLQKQQNDMSQKKQVAKPNREKFQVITYPSVTSYGDQLQCTTHFQVSPNTWLNCNVTQYYSNKISLKTSWAKQTFQTAFKWMNAIQNKTHQNKQMYQIIKSSDIKIVLLRKGRAPISYAPRLGKDVTKTGHTRKCK